MELKTAASMKPAILTDVSEDHLPNTIAVIRSQSLGIKPLQAKDLYVEDAFVPAPSENTDLAPNLVSVRSELQSLVSSLDGNTILVLLPTANQDKASILESVVPENIPVRFEIVKAESDVGEQPYNAAGIQGAMNRIANATKLFLSEASPMGPAKSYCTSNNIGRILVVSIENYINGTQTRLEHTLDPEMKSIIPGQIMEDVEQYSASTLHEPVDFGIACLHDLSTSRTFTAHSRGVKVPRPKTVCGHEIDLVGYARSKGYSNGDENHGAQTVGHVIDAFTEPSQGRKYNLSQNWHGDVTNWEGNRYTLLGEAVEKIKLEAQRQGIFRVGKPATAPLTSYRMCTIL